MSLGHLWAAWRAEYVTGTNDEAEQPGCVFCAILSSSAPDRERHVVAVTEHAAAILNAYPYTSGHLLVLPTRHVGGLDELDDVEAGALWQMARTAVAAVGRAYDPGGVNFGANFGKAAGAGIPDHLHLHVVPRWYGDTNFMTTIGGTRVLPESLGDSFDKLRSAWPS